MADRYSVSSRLCVEPFGDARFRSPAQRLRHHADVYQDHSRSTGRVGAVSRCAKLSNSSSVNLARRPTAVSSVPSAVRPSGRTVSPRMARTSASVLRPRRAAPHTQGAMHLVGQVADGQHGHMRNPITLSMPANINMNVLGQAYAHAFVGHAKEVTSFLAACHRPF